MKRIYLFIFSIRKVQNYDWSDEYIRKANDCIDLKNYEKALEHFRDAEKLDSLNNKIFISKALCLIKMVFKILLQIGKI